jgi:hypothetical protein
MLVPTSLASVLRGYVRGVTGLLRYGSRSTCAVAAVGCMLGLAGCTDSTGGPLGSGSGTPEPTASVSPSGVGTGTETGAPIGTLTGTPTGTPGAGACDLLTSDEIAATAGRKVGRPVSRSVAGASICQYDDIAVTRLQSSVTAKQFDQTVGRVVSAVQEQVKPVEGIGDAAAYIPLLKEICVVREPTFFCIAGFEQPQSEQLAAKAVARL